MELCCSATSSPSLREGHTLGTCKNTSWMSATCSCTRPRPEKHANDRVVQESNFTGYDPTGPESTHLVPIPHRGDGSIKEEFTGAFSLAASASTIVRFIGKHARPRDWWKGHVCGV